MKHVLWRTVPIGIVALWLLGTPTGAPQAAEKANSKASTGESGASAAIPNVEERALAILKKANDFLVQTQRFSVTVVNDYDSVQDSGVKIEYGATRKYTIRRPDRVRIDTEQRTGNQRGFFFDG